MPHIGRRSVVLRLSGGGLLEPRRGVVFAKGGMVALLVGILREGISVFWYLWIASTTAHECLYLGVDGSVCSSEGREWSPRYDRCPFSAKRLTPSPVSIPIITCPYPAPTWPRRSLKRSAKWRAPLSPAIRSTRPISHKDTNTRLALRIINPEDPWLLIDRWGTGPHA